MKITLSPQKQRILFLASSAPRFPGDSTAPFILNMAKDLRDLGWEVEILVPHAPGLRKKEDIDGVIIRRFQYMWPASLQVLCYNGGAAGNLRRNRLNLLAVPFLVIAELLNGLAFLLRRRPSLIHSHWVVPQGAVGQILSVFGTPHVISVHGADVYGFQGGMMRAIKRWALGSCDHVVANSTSTKRAIEELCQPTSLSVIPTGTTPTDGTHTNRAARSAYANADTRIILFVGRLIEEKGLRYLLDALPSITAACPAILLVVGDGPERDALQQQAIDQNLGDCVVFVGPVPHSSIYDYYSVADVFVGPSLDVPGVWTEAQGNTFVEALFAKVPVVATRVGGIPDAIIHEHTGLLVDQRSSEQISQSVLRIFSDTSLRESLATSGYHRAMTRFSRFQSARKLDAIYRSALTGRA